MGLITSAARLTGADLLPVLTACGTETPNCIIQKSNEGQSQLASHQWIQGEVQGHTQIVTVSLQRALALPPCTEWSHMLLPATFKGVKPRHG